MGFWGDVGDAGEAVGEFFVSVGTLGGFKIWDNHNRSDNADNERSTLDNDGKQAWEGDRSIIGDEMSRLLAGTAVTMEGEKVSPEAFSTWSHQQIWDALRGKDGQPGVDAGQINASADAWRRLTTGTETAVNNYRTSFERVLSEKWSGASGNSAIDGVKSYTTEAAKLPTTFQMVANGIDYMEGVLGQAKIAIPKPEEVSTFDEFVSHIPGNGVVKAAKHRANEAEEDARLFMIGTYQPGSITVDRQTPILPLPHNNIGDPGSVPGTGNNGDTGGSNGNTGGNNGGNPATDTAGTQQDPAATSPQSTDPGDDQNEDETGDDSTEPSATDPAATTPAATTPVGTGTPTTPGGGSPGTGSPGSGSPGSGVPNGGTPGAAVPGTPGGAGAAAGAAGNRAGAGSAAGGRGMGGMPGMMGGGRGGGKGEDDSEHAIPDYLIQDREDELIGLLPPTLPPGGVIGA
ncbi:PPE domain-containing protein [Nocardia sp. FBN12]|uniref:PPE domain-containing protein n=1 Tax=Nocardia sp. FBN12 TaxID=3419766 RepID=UPI003D04DFC5